MITANAPWSSNSWALNHKDLSLIQDQILKVNTFKELCILVKCGQGLFLLWQVILNLGHWNGGTNFIDLPLTSFSCLCRSGTTSKGGKRKLGRTTMMPVKERVDVRQQAKRKK